LASLAVQKTITLVDDADGSGDLSWGDTVRFQIVTVNNTNLVLASAVISDTLPSTVDYVPRSSKVRGAPISDDSPPRTIFPFDEGGSPVGDLGPTQVVTGTYRAVVKEGVDEICNTAGADSPSVPGPGEATTCAPVQPSIPTPTPTREPEPEPEDPTSTPLPPPTATPMPTPLPTQAPVMYLPETGIGHVRSGVDITRVLVLVGAGLVTISVGWKLIRRE
jgi:uncharacterized repeat protein (TIGR01451 family)